MSVVSVEPGSDEPNLAFVFPGQGSQYVGMGKALFEASAAARRIFHQADEILGFKLSQLCFEGPADELEDTFNAQPAILTVSLACLAALREKLEERDWHRWQPRFVAGHSLGEYTALVAAGALDFADALRLVRERGRIMKEHGDDRPGGMAAVVGLQREVLEQVCREVSEGANGQVIVANANTPEQFVISGDMQPLQRAIVLAKDRGARNVVLLRISIASHSPLMVQAASKLSELIARANLSDPQVPIVANIAGQILTTAEQIRAELAEQMTAPVEWVGSVRQMAAHGVDTFIEVGPGQVLSRLIKRISVDVRALNIADADATDLGPARRAIV